MTSIQAFRLITLLNIIIFTSVSGYGMNAIANIIQHQVGESSDYEDGNLSFLDYMTSETLPKVKVSGMKK